MTHTTSGVIFLINDDTYVIENRYVFPPNAVHPEPRLSDPNGITRQVMKNGEVMPFSTFDERVNPEVAISASSMIAVPIKLEKGPIGVLFLNSKEHHEFTKMEENLLMNLGNQAAIAIYKKQRENELKGLNEINQNLMLSSDIRTLLETILKTALDLTSTGMGSIYLISEDGKFIQDKFILPQEFGPGSMDISWDGLTSEMLKTKKEVIVEDTAKDPRVSSHILDYGIKSFIGQPLILENRVVGVMYLNDRSYHHFSNTEKLLVRALASNTALAIFKTGRQALYLNAINKVAGFTGHKTDKQAVVEQIVEEACSSMQASYCVLFILKDDLLCAQAAANLTLDPQKPICFPKGEGLAGLVIEKGVAIKVDEAASDRRFYPDKLPPSNVERRMALAPLWAEGKVSGVLSVTRDGGKKFDDTDLRFLEILAVEAGIAIYRAEPGQRRQKAFTTRFNPYIVGPPIYDPDRFFGREEAIQQILGGVLINHYLILGERRIGKSSLLKQLEFHLNRMSKTEKCTYLPVSFNFQGVEDQFFFWELGDIVWDAAEMGDFPLDKDKYSDRSLVKDLKKVVEKLKKQNPYHEVRIVLLMDEVNKFANPEGGYTHRTHEKFRSVLSEVNEVKAVMAGTSYQQIESITSPWFNMFKKIFLEEVSPACARQILIEQVQDIYKYEEESIRLLVCASDCKPFYIQSLASNAVNAMFQRCSLSQKTPDEFHITPADIKKSIQVVFGESSDQFEMMWKAFSVEKQQALLTACQNKKPLTPGEYKPGMNSLFSREELHIIARIIEGKAHLTYFFSRWLQERGKGEKHA